MQRHPTVLVVEHGHQLEPGAEGAEVLAERGDAYVGVLEFGDVLLRSPPVAAASAAWLTASAWRSS